MRSPGLLLATILLLIAACPAMLLAQTTVELAFPGFAPSQQWQLLAVKVHAPPGGATVSIKDDRGGVEVARSLDAAALDPVSGDSQVLLPLPLLAPANLPADTWPIEITIRSAVGTVTREHIAVRRTSAGAPLAAAANFRVARPPNFPTAALPWPHAGQSPVVFLTMPDDEILSGPPLVFAACDALLLNDRLITRLTTERLAALLNTGIQLAMTRDPAGENTGPVLGRLSWTHTGQGAAQLWITNASTYARPSVLEDGLARARTLDISATPARSTIALVLLVPIGALIALLLARGLFRSPVHVLIAAILAFAAVAVGAIAYLRSSALPATQNVSWTSTAVAQPLAHTSLSINDSFTATSALFGQHLQVTAEHDAVLFPVTDSARRYFALKNASLLLDALADDGIRRLSRLDLAVPRRGLAIYALRSASLLAGAGDPLHSPGVWIEGGYVTPTALQTDNPHDAGPTIFTEWAAKHPTQKDALLTWYELRFAASHRYFLPAFAQAESPDVVGNITFLDFGPTTSISPPP